MVKCSICGSENFIYIDTLCTDIDLDEERFWISERVQCENCKDEFKIDTEGSLDISTMTVRED